MSEADSEDYKSAPSIPSKYETVLNKGPSERDGFLSRSSRFSYSDVRYCL